MKLDNLSLRNKGLFIGFVLLTGLAISLLASYWAINNFKSMALDSLTKMQSSEVSKSEALSAENNLLKIQSLGYSAADQMSILISDSFDEEAQESLTHIQKQLSEQIQLLKSKHPASYKPLAEPLESFNKDNIELVRTIVEEYARPTQITSLKNVW